MDLLLGALAVTIASFLGGVTGFGYSLVCTPLLLLIGFPLRFVVTVNLAIPLVMRLPVAVRFREHISWRRAGALIGGSVPGLWLGTQVLTTVPESTIKVVAGLVAMIAAVLLARSLGGPAPRRVPGAALAAGLIGGFMGASTSLNGVAPAVLMARDKASARSFLADLALYFMSSAAVGLTILAAEGALSEEALWPAFVLWVPGSLVGSWLGTTVGPRLPELGFRRLTLAVVFVAGGVTALTA